MKLLFSEAPPDYAHYVFPYAIWAFPEAHETPADLFRAGFLPSSRQLDRFYLCRQIRIKLSDYRPSSENRRILRKGQGLEATIMPRAQFEFTPARREFCLRYAQAKFGAGGLSAERLDSLFQSPVTTHLLLLTDRANNAEVGIATLYLEANKLAFYYYGFYALDHPNRSLGMFLMTSAARSFAADHYEFLHLGTCYTEAALYKTQFAGFEFFNGLRWSNRLSELKFILQRQQKPATGHLLECPDYLLEAGEADLVGLAARSTFRA